MNNLTTALEHLSKTIKGLDPAIDLDELMLRALFEDTLLANAEAKNIDLDSIDADSNWMQIETFLQANIDDYPAFVQQCADEFIQEYKKSLQEE